MTTPDPYQTWLQGNSNYVAAATTWVRLKLEQVAQQYQPSQAPPAQPSPMPAREPNWLGRLLGQAPAQTPVQTPPAAAQALPAAPKPTPIQDSEVQQAFTTMQQAESSLQPPPMLSQIAQCLGLSSFDQHILLLCSAMETNPNIPTLCARAQDNPARPYPTFALAMALFKDEARWDALAADRPLRHYRLLEINQPASQPLTSSALRADESIINAIKGLYGLDDRLASLFTPLSPSDPQTQLPFSQNLAVEAALGQIQRNTQHPIPIVQLVGPDLDAQQLVAQHTTARLNSLLYRLPLEYLPTNLNELETLTVLWQRESLLRPIALLIDTHDSDKPEQLNALRRFLDRGNGIVFIATREPIARLERPTTSIEVQQPTALEQRSAWNDALGPTHSQDATQLAAQFNLGQTDIQQIAHTLALTGQSPLETAWNACRALARPRLDSLAQRLTIKASKDQLVLPENEHRTLEQLIQQVRTRGIVYEDWGFAKRMNRGLGISALFAGESGTGKTMAAEVIANELKLDLYRIDLSSVVSKYIGETEKNLRRIFDAAERGGAILFFDEADALFGKRSEVKDSHDRYANIEVNYLLQRMEAFSGLAVLASNQKNALDSAFTRRLRFIITFPFPGQPERQRLWANAFPTDTPIETLELQRLARFDLTGASIHNAAMNAAFLAANHGSTAPVNMQHVLEAIRSEYRKLDRPINELEFRAAPVGAA